MAAIQSSVLASPTEDEILVAQILLDLPSMIRKLESGFAFQWGSKKMRSRFNDSSIKTSFQKPNVEVGEREPPPKAATEEVAATASPVTPLAFPPSESDENPTHSFKRNSKKRSREKYIDTIEELTQRRDLLREEIAIVNNYYQNLIAYNSDLKAFKQQVLNSCERKEESNFAEEAQPLAVDEMAEKFEHSIGPISAQFNNGLRSVNHVGPLGIPDLNISAEESSYGVDLSRPLDIFADRRARFAEARRRRMDIIKIKSERSSTSGLKLLRTK